MSLAVAEQTQPRVGRTVASPINLLILDDNAFDAQRLKRSLKQLDPTLEVTMASDLAEFDKYLRTRKFEFAFIDYFLPDGDGLEALCLVHHRRQNRRLATIMVVGEADVEVAEAARYFGCRQYLSKSALCPETLGRAMSRAKTEARRSKRSTRGARHKKPDLLN